MKRFLSNPVITRNNIISLHSNLKDVSSVFNPGAIYSQDTYILLLRVQNRGRETFIVRAVSDDGYNFDIDSSSVIINGLDKVENHIFHIYDPRITEIDNNFYVTAALDIDSGCRVGLFQTKNFTELDFIGLITDEDARNGVLLPEKINNKYQLLIRPNQTLLESGVTTGSTISLFESENLTDWTRQKDVMSGRPHYWDELIGSGPPPVKTKIGWLHIYHGVATHFQSSNIYQAGVLLLDLENPSKVIARCKYNILEPRELYELVGQVSNVVFPSGMIVEQYDEEGFALPESEVKIYYGAADTAVCLAESTIQQLLDACFV